MNYDDLIRIKFYNQFSNDMKLNVVPQALINSVMRADVRCLNDVRFYLK